MNFFKALIPSSFASAERKEIVEVRAEAERLKKGLRSYSFLDILPDPIVILNPERQILFASHALLDFLKLTDDSSLIGQRPGEVLNCCHACNDSGGCGTTKFCRQCGAVQAILHTQKFHADTSRDCRILSSSDHALNFRIRTSYFTKNGREYTLMVMHDIADEVYRDSLEHIFFHDLMNIASGLYGVLSVIDDDAESYRENRQLLVGLTEELLEEINSQRDLLAAEDGSIRVSLSQVESREVMNFAIGMLANQQAAAGREIVVDAASEDITFKTDSSLLKRIIVNLTKNALEASMPGDEVVLKSIRSDDKVIFETHNRGYIQPEVQLQIFNRAFTTKGRGRGLGTYSAKLLSEKYLHGQVYFTSSEEHGTSFFVELPLDPEVPNPAAV